MLLSSDRPPPMSEQSDHCEDENGPCHIPGVTEDIKHETITTSEVIAHTGQRAAPNGDSDEREEGIYAEVRLAEASGQ